MTVIAEWNGPQFRILAGLAARAGTAQHSRPGGAVAPAARLEAEVEHWIDPSLATPNQSDLGERRAGDSAAARRPDPRRRGEVAAAPRSVACDPGPAGEGGRPALVVCPTATALIEAMTARWHFPRDRNGQVSRELPEKDHPWSDLGDALCYAVGGAKPWKRGQAGARPPYRAVMASPPLGARVRPRPGRGAHRGFPALA